MNFTGKMMRVSLKNRMNSDEALDIVYETSGTIKAGKSKAPAAKKKSKNKTFKRKIIKKNQRSK
jgi:hypothetical protein